MQKIKAGSTSNVVELVRLRDATTGNYLTTPATVTITDIVTTGGASVNGQSYPAVMNYAKPGRYRVTLDAGLAVVVGELYDIHLLVQLGGMSAEFVETVLCIKVE